MCLSRFIPFSVVCSHGSSYLAYVPGESWPDASRGGEERQGTRGFQGECAVTTGKATSVCPAARLFLQRRGFCVGKLENATSIGNEADDAHSLHVLSGKVHNGMNKFKATNSTTSLWASGHISLKDTKCQSSFRKEKIILSSPFPIKKKN